MECDETDEDVREDKKEKIQDMILYKVYLSQRIKFGVNITRVPLKYNRFWI